MVKRSDDSLQGMAEIEIYVGRSAPTVLKWHLTMDLPIKKLGGVWEGSKKAIDRWRDMMFPECPQAETRPKRRRA